MKKTRRRKKSGQLFVSFINHFKILLQHIHKHKFIIKLPKISTKVQKPFKQLLNQGLLSFESNLLQVNV